MGKKRRGPTLEELLARPWCYYCERDFDDLKILISHQKAKHFKCDRCNRKLNTAGGLSVHLSQVHKEQLTAVDNALPNRSGLDVEIFGMEGVPEDVIQAHNQRVLTQFQQAEVERQAVTGNPPSGAGGAGGGGGGQPAKKPKFESPSDLKKRLAEHKAKRAEGLAGGSSGEATPVGAEQSMQSPGGFAQSPQPPAAAVFNTAAMPTGQYPSYPTPYTGAASPTHPSASPAYQHFPQPSGHPHPHPQYPPPTQYAPSGYSPPPFPGGPHGVPALPYGASPPPYAPQLQQPVRTHTPPQQQQMPHFPPRAPSLPSAPGLPQRPAFGVPQVNAHQLQQMHMGPPIPTAGAAQGGLSNGQTAEMAPAGLASSVDDLISGAARQADEAATATATAKPSTPKPVEPTEEKPSKKDKSKATRLVYADNETSPEEKMARQPRYAFVPDRKGEVVLGELPAAVVVGTIRESDTVIDSTR